ncbi:DUF2279 domain-containing protein [Neolewinella agarilytica]|uniref:Predicted lipoprotein n=1 Tax=Neolewinella agarilytica TaxID=478744 RepID=A0A1H9NE59_9BACT|nr:DUF2279 domain-containing protein [Neolewinella agarilytica]SER33929.1 Predicted lipoprotein [Neolewinella agarilytica]
MKEKIFFQTATVRLICFLFLFGGSQSLVHGQLTDFTLRDPLAHTAQDNWLRPDSTFNRSRFRIAAGTGTALYGVASIGLYQTWYSDFDMTGLHSFNDWPQWNQMDKAGHMFTAYMFTRYSFSGLRWAGLKRPAARYTAMGVGNLLQATIEVMDGYSAEWGFSWSDLGANLTGTVVFAAQDALWHEQRILIKVSSDLRQHPDIPIINQNGAMSNLGDISRERFGTNFFEKYLKDYNAQTYWLSANPRSFLPKSKIPHWLNISLGYGVENVYGAYGNTWARGRERFNYPNQRYRQWYLSPDIYFSRIPTKKRGVRLLLGILDSFKLPAPALEFSQGRFRAHWLQ